MQNFEPPRASDMDVRQYTPPRLYQGKDWYVGFMAYDPVRGCMRRKRYKLNFIEKVGERRRYADGLIKRLNSKLEQGWNPWVESETGLEYHRIDDVIAHYRRSIEKLWQDDYYREDTYISYSSYIRNFERWYKSLQVPLVYIYQYNSTIVQQFLDHIYIDRDNSPQTRDNYLLFLKTLDTWLVQKKYMKNKPTDGIPTFGRRRNQKKNRTVISDKDMVRLRDYLMGKNRHYLLASYVLFYCFVRPKEMANIKIEHISLKRQTLYIPADSSKNRKDGTVTLPKKVIEMMLELNIFDNPSSYYLFSDGFMPGSVYRDSKQFRDFWSTRVRKDLKFNKEYKFYSLKDTGITSMLKKYKSITVRDQARHSSVLMTDLYTPHDLQEADELIKNHEADF